MKLKDVLKLNKIIQIKDERFTQYLEPLGNNKVSITYFDHEINNWVIGTVYHTYDQKELNEIVPNTWKIITQK